ncbi:hypothetical protein T4E_1297 [Trichinella pseudospiralis]|uniref:Uncharacterized protein n=1 Tax=Trichinella pseudospiralis TaxID=6337 RepID=A0A0V0XF82_TRIPS|nr:hypothetical protein T4E_1297 [Trichinella pseudospiralis]
MPSTRSITSERPEENRQQLEEKAGTLQNEGVGFSLSTTIYALLKAFSIGNKKLKSDTYFGNPLVAPGLLSISTCVHGYSSGPRVNPGRGVI